MQTYVEINYLKSEIFAAQRFKLQLVSIHERKYLQTLNSDYVIKLKIAQ